MLEYIKFFANLWPVWILCGSLTLFIKSVCEEKLALLIIMGKVPSMKLKLFEKLFQTLTFGFVSLVGLSLGSLLLLKLISYFHST